MVRDEKDLLTSIQQVLGVPDEGREHLPEIVTSLLKQAATPGVITILFDQNEQRLLHIVASTLPRTSASYLGASKVAMQLAQYFNDLALKVSTIAVTNTPPEV